MEFIFTQVLIIGGGIAGMRAALAAREKGAEVVLLSKGKCGKSGSSLVSNTHHRIHTPGQPFNLDMIIYTLQSGQGLAEEDLVRVLATESMEVVKELQQWGCLIQIDHYNGKRNIPIYASCKGNKGVMITQKLRQKVEEEGIKILDNHSVVRLITNNGRVVGVFACHDDQIFCFLASAVVLASGGIGRIYYPSNNPVDVNGEGIALAWQSGAELIDLEFVQFWPYQLIAPRFMGIEPSIFRLGGRLMNQHGDHFMVTYPEQELVEPDILNREMILQNGEITLDLMDMELTDLEKVNPRLLRMYLADKDIVVSPVQHFSMGGVRMDQNGHSTVPGLYVCGEVGAGIHGANRIEGNSLTECLVFGRRAGWNAALEALQMEMTLSKEDLDTLQKQLYIPEEGKENYLLVQARLGHLMWEGAGIIRDGERLRGTLGELKKDIVAVENSKPRSITEWYQVRNRLITARLITEAALCREESRGAHYRLDFPETDPEWEGHIVICKYKIYLHKKSVYT